MTVTGALFVAGGVVEGCGSVGIDCVQRDLGHISTGPCNVHRLACCGRHGGRCHSRPRAGDVANHCPAGRRHWRSADRWATRRGGPSHPGSRPGDRDCRPCLAFWNSARPSRLLGWYICSPAHQLGAWTTHRRWPRTGWGHHWRGDLRHVPLLGSCRRRRNFHVRIAVSGRAVNGRQPKGAWPGVQRASSWGGSQFSVSLISGGAIARA
jgi:hypothetical protein